MDRCRSCWCARRRCHWMTAAFSVGDWLAIVGGRYEGQKSASRGCRVEWFDGGPNLRRRYFACRWRLFENGQGRNVFDFGYCMNHELGSFLAYLVRFLCKYKEGLCLNQGFGSASFFCGSGSGQKSSCGSGSWGYPGEGGWRRKKMIVFSFFRFQMILNNGG